MDKQTIIESIRRIARVNGGKPPGTQSFERETGVKMADWYPHMWLRWGDALQEAGFTPNKYKTAFSDDILISKYIALVRELKRIPVIGEIRLKAKSDKSFPSHTVFTRFGTKSEIIGKVLEWCHQHLGYDDIIALCSAHGGASGSEIETINDKATRIPTGFVYLMKSGRHYKIGRTNSVGRRQREFAIVIPVPPRTIHSIETDDPPGVEEYWHKRFSSKRGEGEWFDLSPDDIKAFKRWKRIT